LFNLNVTRRMKSEKVERPHITRFSQAVAWATEKAKISGDQTSKGTIPVRAEKASLIEPGSIFLLTDDELATSEAQRCTRKAESLSSGVVKLTHETERGLSPQPYSATPAAPTAELGPNPAAIRNYAAVQLPSSLADGLPDQLALLASRGNEHTSSLDVWFQSADLTSYQLLASQHGFGVAGAFRTDIGNNEVNSLSVASQRYSSVIQGNTYTLPAKNFWSINVKYWNPFPAGAPTASEGIDYTVDIEAGTITILTGGSIPTGYTVDVKIFFAIALLPDANTPAPDLERIKSALTDDEKNNGEILIFAFQSANPALFEIMKVNSVTSGATLLGVSVQRQAYGTLYGGDGTHNFTDNDFAFIVFKDDLTPLSHDSFAALHKVNGAANFLLAPRSAWMDADPADLYDPASNPDGLSTTFSYTFNNIYAPTLTWISQQYDGADITDWGATFDTGKVFKLSFEVKDTNADLTHVAINAVLGQELVTLYSQNFDPSSSQVGVLAFTLPKNGRWKIFVDVLDSSGNQARYFLPTADGSSILVNHNNNNSGTPIIYSYDVRGNFIANLIFGYQRTSTTVKWQIKNRGVAHDATGTGGVWTTAPTYGAAVGSTQLYGPVANFQRGTKTLYAFTQHSGDNDSAVVEWNL
jgi:hypothetical protein